MGLVPRLALSLLVLVGSLALAPKDLRFVP
jgi:hypothetical protein